MVRQLFYRSGVYFFGLTIVKFLSVFLFVLLARLLQPELFGKLSYFMTLLSLVTIIADWGLVQWFQVHRREENESKLIGQSVAARILTLFLSGVLFAMYVTITQAFTVYESILFLVLLVPEAFTSFVDGYYLVRRQSALIALKQFSKYLLPVLYVLFFRESITFTGVLTTFLCSSVITMMWYLPKRYFQSFSFSWSRAKETLKESSSYAFLLLTSAFYSRGDAIILKSTIGDAAVGLYSAGYRYLDAMSLFPSAFAQNLFHISAQQNFLDKSKVLTMTAGMGVIGLVFGGILFSFSRLLTVGILGEAYLETEIVVKIFGIVTVLLFVNSPLSTIVQSSTLVKQFLPWGVLNTFLNIGLNIIVIPILGLAGAALVMLLTEATGLLINIYFVKQRLKMR